jgi:hypothetical protein
LLLGEALDGVQPAVPPGIDEPGAGQDGQVLGNMQPVVAHFWPLGIRPARRGRPERVRSLPREIFPRGVDSR